MHDLQEAKPAAQGTNGSLGAAEQTAELPALREECERLRQALAQAETERNWYLKALYEYARKDPELKQFENMDIATLEAMSAGPVELFLDPSQQSWPGSWPHDRALVLAR